MKSRSYVIMSSTSSLSRPICHINVALTAWVGASLGEQVRQGGAGGACGCPVLFDATSTPDGATERRPGTARHRTWETRRRGRSSPGYRSPMDDVVAHSERATLRVGEVFPTVNADRTRIDVEVEEMPLAPAPNPEVLWRRPPVLAVSALPGTTLGSEAGQGMPCTTSPPSRSDTRSASTTSSPVTAPTRTSTSSTRGGRREACRLARRLRRPEQSGPHALGRLIQRALAVCALFLRAR